jgi:preprotein translocase subunit SecA
MITRAIENAQKKVEARNFDIRKHLLDYDNVMNKQRQAFYGKRREVLAREEIHDEVLELTEGEVVNLLERYWPAKGDPDEEGLADLAKAIEAQLGVPFDPREEPFLVGGKPARDRDGMGRAVFDRVLEVLEEKRRSCDAIAEEYATSGYPRFADFERSIFLQTLDRQWKDHLHAMDGLREGVSLRGYAQRDPKIEYQREGFGLFEEMNQRVDAHVSEILFKFELPDPVRERRAPAAGEGAAEQRPGLPRPPATKTAKQKSGKVGKVGRNSPCPCGSGKKYKKCCGAA